MGVGKVPGETEGSHKTSKLEGNHDNPVRGIHQAPSHWESQWRNVQILIEKYPEWREGWEPDWLKLLYAKTWAKWLTSVKALQKFLKPKTAPDMISDGEQWPVLSLV